MLILPLQVNAYVLPVADFGNLFQNITTAIQSGLNTASQRLREVSEKTREAYQLITKTQAVQTTINTYKNLLEVTRVYNKTKQLYDIVTGNPGFSSLMRVAGDRDVRELMGNDWEYMVDEIDGAADTFTGTDRRFRSAMNRFENGNLPYNSDLVYIDPKLWREKEIYEDRYKRNKTFSVLSQVAIERTEDDIEKVEKLESTNDFVETPKERDALRNAILIAQLQSNAEANRLRAMQLKQKAEEIEETRQRRANDVILVTRPIELF